MTSFAAIENYSSLSVFIYGFVTFFGVTGTGILMLRWLKLQLPFPWNGVAGILTGILTESLMVQVAGMAGISSKPILISIWLLFIIPGNLKILYLIIKKRIIIPIRTPQKTVLFAAIPIIIALIANFISAIAPSTKIDELYYHMLLPARIVSDGALKFYRFPIESAALPQMIYQISLTPLHSLGYPDSGNVVSLFLNFTLVYFGWHLIRKAQGNLVWSWLWVAPLCVGMHPVIWNVTGGASAFGELALVASVLWLLFRKSLLKEISVVQYNLAFSIYVVSFVSSKVSLIPLGIVMMLMNFAIEIKTNPRKQLLKDTVFMVLPWIIYYFPILIWTWIKSGAPFGPLTPGLPGLIKTYNIPYLQSQLEYMRSLNIPSWGDAIKYSLIEYTPILWIGIILIFYEKAVPKEHKILIFCLLCIQSFIIFELLFFDFRFYGGLIQAFCLYFAIIASQTFKSRLLNWKPGIVAAIVFFLVPWVSLQSYFVSQFAGIVTGKETKEEFYRTNTAFYQDYQWINRTVRENAVILFNGPVRLNCVYAPRPISFSPEEIPSERPVILMNAGEQINISNVYPEFITAEKIYENKAAVCDIFRLPGKPPKTINLCFYRLWRKGLH